jgi:hypothetical protein
MTADTTFKEFVEEKGLKFSLLDFCSPEYENLVEAFNKVKFRMEAEEDARETERERLRLGLSERPATKKVRNRLPRRLNIGPRFVRSHP